MKRDSSVSASSSPLRTLGLGPIEDRIYRSLLRRDGTSAAEIAKRLALSVRSSQRVLNALEQKGLVTHSPEQVQRYSAVPPDIAAEVLIAQRHGELHQARAAMARLRNSAEDAPLYQWPVIGASVVVSAAILYWFHRLPYARTPEESLQEAIEQQSAHWMAG